jgi:hypothetical protein
MWCFRISGAGLLLAALLTVFPGGCIREEGPEEGGGTGPHGTAAPPPKGPAQDPPADPPAPRPEPAAPPALDAAGREKLRALLAKLENEDWTVRDEGVRGIVALGAAAAPEIAGRLDPAHPRRTVEILSCLDHIGSGGAEEILALLSKTDDYDITVFGLKALGSIGDKKAAAALEKYLGWVLPGKEEEIAKVPEDDRISKVIVPKMHDCREGKVRNQAAESLARLGDVSGIPLLIQGLRGNGWVRRDAIVSLRKLTACEVDFGFCLDATRPDRETAVKKWEEWWEKNRTTFRPRYRVLPEVYDIYSPRGK